MADLRSPANRMAAAMAVSFRTSVRDAALTGAAAQGSVMEYLGKAIAARAIPRGQLQRAHQDVGNQARRAMVAGYTHRRHRRAVPSYRMGDRFAGGALRRALNSPGMVEATPYVLRFVNVDVLNAEAGHWKRLNYGAGAGSDGGISPPEQFPIRWDGMVRASIGLTPNVQPAFTIPQGRFMSPGGQRVPAAVERRGQDMFFLGNPRRRFPTAGIASSNFLDTGVRRLASGYPRAYLDMYTRLFNSAARSRSITLKAGQMPVPGVFRP